MHAFYVNDQQQARIDLTTDRNTLRTVFSSGFPTKISYAPVPSPQIRTRSNWNQPTSTDDGDQQWKIITAQPYTAPPQQQHPAGGVIGFT